MDYQALADEINNDPQGMGYDQHLPEDHVSVADLLGKDDPAGATGPIPVQPSALREYAAGGLRVKIDQGTSNSDAAAAATCRQLQDFMIAPNAEPLTITQGKTATLMQNLVDQGVITTQEKSDLEARFTRTLRREEAVLGKGTTVSPQDVTKALN